MGGPKGGGFVFDTNALHRGVVAGTQPRSVLILEFNDAAKDAEWAVHNLGMTRQYSQEYVQKSVRSRSPGPASAILIPALIPGVR